MSQIRKATEFTIIIIVDGSEGEDEDNYTAVEVK